jgi:putative drug exporter of the RND superfamily
VDAVNGVGKLARLPCGRRTKWLVLALWVAVLAVAGPLAGQLTSAEKNDAASWLPARAESTQVLHLAERFQPSDDIPAIVVYERQSGLTAADRATVASDAREFGDVVGVDRDVIGPIPSRDGTTTCRICPG